MDVGLHRLEVLHDDVCARLAGTGPCDYAPHLRLGMCLVRWEESPMPGRP